MTGANTYTGVLTISNGTLSVSTLADGLAASNIGASSNAAANLVLDGGTLRYTGSGHSTNRLFTLTNNGGTIDASGSGALNFTNTGSVAFTGSGVRTLTLTGSNTNNNTLATVLGDGTGGASSLTKAGIGTWVLAGTNSYTGLSTISDGTLVVAANDALGTIAGGTTVSSGATLEISNGIVIGAEALNLSGTGVSSNGALVVTSGNGSYGGTVTLGASASIGGNGSLTLGGAVNGVAPGTSTLTQVGSGTLTFSNTAGATNALAAVTTSAGQITAINGGSVRTTGAQNYGGIVTSSVAATLTSTGGGNITANNTSNNFNGNLVLGTSGVASIVDSNALALGASSIGTLTAQTLTGNLTLNGAITASGSGDAIVLAAAGNFVNNIGAGALTPGSGRWLVYSTSPLSDTRGGLVYDFKQYNATYGVTTVLGTGNGFLYTLAPIITPGLTGTVSRVYNSGTIATLVAGNFTATGAVDSDTVMLNGTGAYDTKNVGSSKLVTATGITASATNGAASVYGYRVLPTTASANIGTITAKAIAATGLSGVNKIYNTTTVASLTGTAAITSGATADGDGLYYTGDTVSLTGTAAGAFANKNVGTSKAVTISGLALGGADSGNYTVSHANASADITAKAIAASGITANNKVYNATTVASLNTGAAAISNGAALDGDGLYYTADTVTLNTGSATGAFANKNVGTGKAVTISGLTLGGAGSGNYTVSHANASANITPASLTITANNASKTFGSTLIFAGTEFASSGLQGSETIGRVTLASAGAAATAATTNYPIIPSNARDGTFAASNYAITFVDGVLRVTEVLATSEPGAAAAIATVATQVAGSLVLVAAPDLTAGLLALTTLPPPVGVSVNQNSPDVVISPRLRTTGCGISVPFTTGSGSCAH